MKLTVINQTQYNVHDLEKFFLAGLKAMGASTGKMISVRTGRRSYFSGRGRYGYGPDKQGRYITMFIPPRKDMKSTQDKAGFARVFEHEVLHTLGVRHREMSDDVLYCKGGLPDWAQGLDISRAKSESKPKISAEDKTVIKLEHARKMMMDHQRRLKREQNLVTKWKSKARYHEKRLALVAGRAKP